MNAAHTSLTPSPLDRIVPNRSLAWLACATVILAAGCSSTADENNAEPNNTTSTNGMPNNTTSTNGMPNNTTSTNGMPNNTTSTTGMTNNGSTVLFTLVPIDASTGMLLDAEMCVRDTDNCAAGMGESITLEVPQDTDLALTLTADGFVTATWYVNLAGSGGSYTTPMLPAANLAGLIDAFGFADDPDKGHVFFNAQSATSGLAGVALTLSPDTSEAVLYNSAAGTPNPALMETEFGNGAYVNVDPGSYELTGMHATLACSAPEAHQQTDAGAVKIDVAAGEATYAFVVCED